MTPETIIANVGGLEEREFDNLDDQIEKAIEFRDPAIIFLQQGEKYSPFLFSEKSSDQYSTQPMVFVHGLRGRNHDPYFELPRIFKEGFTSTTELVNSYIEQFDPDGMYIWARQWAERSSHPGTAGDRYLLEIESAIGQAPDPIACSEKDTVYIPRADPEDIRLIVLFDSHLQSRGSRIELYHRQVDDVMFI